MEDWVVASSGLKQIEDGSNHSESGRCQHGSWEHALMPHFVLLFLTTLKLVFLMKFLVPVPLPDVRKIATSSIKYLKLTTQSYTSLPPLYGTNIVKVCHRFAGKYI